MKKKSLLAICLATVLVLSLVGACAAPAPAPAPAPKPAPAPAPELPVLKIGMPLALTGVVAESAKEQAEIFQMYIDENGGTLGGLPVKVFVEDTETQAEMVVTKTEKLINHDQVHLLTGPILALEARAMSDSAVRAKIAHLSMAGSPMADIRGAAKFANIARISYGSFSQETLPFGDYAYKEMGYRKIAIIGQDYTWGWENSGGFQYSFEQAGGQIVQKLWAPIGTTDYAPFVTQLRKDVDAIYAVLIGTDVLRFAKAYQDFGLKDKIPLLGSEDFAGEDVMRYYGDEAIGIISALYSPSTLDRPEMRKFVEQSKKHFGGRIPSFWADSAYVAAMWIDRALLRLRDEGVPANQLPEFVRNNAVRFIEAVKATNLPDAPTGNLSLDDYNSVIRDIHLVKLVKKEGKIVSEPFYTFPGVSAFWKYNPTEFLAQPDFSREYPPVK